MSFKSSLKNNSVFMWKFASVQQSFRKRHKKIYENSNFKKIKLTKKEKNDYLKYWKVISPIVNLDTVEITKSLTGEYNKHIVPEEFYPLYIEPQLNPRHESVFLENKSFYNKWFDGSYFPKDYFHKIDSQYYDKNLEIIENIDNYIEGLSFEFPIVLKPSIDSYGGRDIYFINSLEELNILHPKFRNLVVQEKLKQSPKISRFNPDSINSIRVCLLKVEGKFVVINTSLRMGKDGSLDNETAGGIVCSISEDGKLNSFAVDKFCSKHLFHPNTEVVFDGETLPFYSSLISTSQEIAESIFNTDLVSLDMCLDDKDVWRCIELNLFGQTIRFAQYAGKPFFGEYTDYVINKIIKS